MGGLPKTYVLHWLALYFLGADAVHEIFASWAVVFYHFYVFGDFLSDSLSSFCVVESGDGLVEGEGVGADAGDHDGSGGASEGIFEESGEFAVSVGDVCASLFFPVLDEGVDAVAEGEEGFVDVAALVFPLAVLHAEFLGACEVDDVEFAGAVVAFVGGFDVQFEDCM